MFYNSGFVYIKFKGNRFLVLKNAENIQNSMTPYKNSKHMFMIFCRNKSVLKELLEYVDNTYGNKGYQGTDDMEVTSTSKKELFAVNTEVFISS